MSNNNNNNEWTILEKLLLTQAVYKYGENMWFQVARVLKQHGLIQPQQRQSDFFSQKNCQFQYYLLVENLEAEKQLYRSYDLKNDMPVVVRIARQLYTQRVEEVKNNLKKDEEEFGQLAQEIESIKHGRWDEKLKENLSSKANETVQHNTETVVHDQLTENTSNDMKKANSIDSTDSVVSSVPEVEENKLHQHIFKEENRMKRTSSETAIISENLMKRCRLEENNSEAQDQSTNEDQVLSTAISSVSKENESSNNVSLDNVPTVTEVADIIDSNSKDLNRIESTFDIIIESSISDVELVKNGIMSAVTENKEEKETKQILQDESNITQHEYTEKSSDINTSATDSISVLDYEKRFEENQISDFNLIAKDSKLKVEKYTKEIKGSELGHESKLSTIEQQSFTQQYAQQDTLEKEQPLPYDQPTELRHIPQQQKIPKLTELPKLNIPAVSLPSSSYPHHERSVSPIYKINTMTTDEEDFARSETATPTSASDKKRLSSNNNSDQRQKAWQKNINLLWQEVANHKNGTMFMNPIKKSYAPLYDKVVKQPLYLKTIKNRVRDGIVKTTAEFERDVVLMLTNSLMYNKEGTEMYTMALEMLDDFREQIRLFKSADGYSVSFWENGGESQ